MDIKSLIAKFALIFSSTPAGDNWHTVPADKLVDVCRELRDEHKFDCLSCITGIDKGGGNLEVVYHLFSYERKETATLKVLIPPVPPLPLDFARGGEKGGVCPSVSHLWASANWMERETFDLLGINFTGHPDMRRILLPDDWVGWPLRKDYKEETEYKGMSTVR